MFKNLFRERSFSKRGKIKDFGLSRRVALFFLLFFLTPQVVGNGTMEYAFPVKDGNPDCLPAENLILCFVRIDGVWSNNENTDGITVVPKKRSTEITKDGVLNWVDQTNSGNQGLEPGYKDTNSSIINSSGENLQFVGTTPVSLSTLNSFPYRVNNVTCFNTETGNTYTNFGNITGDGAVSSIPMPSTSTSLSTKTDTVTISYDTMVLNKFNATFDSRTKYITLKINYKERPCYHMYDGTSQTDTQVDSQTSWTGLHRKGATGVEGVYTGGEKNIYVKD